MMACALMILNTFLFREEKMYKIHSPHKYLLRSFQVPTQACCMVPVKIRQYNMWTKYGK